MTKRRKRRVWTDDEKRMVCAQARMPGISVSQVVRRYDVNSNLVFTWLRDRRYAPAQSSEGSARFLPVEIVEEQEWRHSATGAESRIEIDLAGGHSLRITGSYDPAALVRLIRGLSA